MIKLIARWYRFWRFNTTPEDQQQRDPKTGKYTITTARRRAANMQDSTRLEWIKWRWQHDGKPVRDCLKKMITDLASPVAVAVISALIVLAIT